MALICCCWLFQLSIIFGVLAALVYFYYSHTFKYWKKKNVRHTNPRFPLGDINGVGKTGSFGEIFRDLYMKYRNERFFGAWIITTPTLVINDPGLIKNVLVKDFNHFHDRGFDVDEELEPLEGHLFTMNGQKWRNLRVKLTPTFTSGKMKMMFPTIVSTGETLKAVLEEKISQNDEIEVKDLMDCYTTDVVSSCAFGLHVSSLRNPNSEFRQMSKDTNKRTLKTTLTNMLTFAIPKAVGILKLHLIPPHVTNFFLKVVRDTIDYREKNNVKRNDFMQLLIQLKNKGYIEDADVDKREEVKDVQNFDFTTEKAAAQAFVFITAGNETSATTLQFTLYELAIRPEIQTKLQKEIDSVLLKHKGEITYDGMQEMTYLEQAVAETLRKYPPASVLVRNCTKSYQIPETDIIIDKGTRVVIPALGIHHNPDMYPDPDRFDPDRFTQEEKERRDHYAYLPFGEGPRICIGNRFASTQIKVALIVMLRYFNVIVCDKTPIPLVFDHSKDFLTTKDGIHLKIQKRT